MGPERGAGSAAGSFDSQPILAKHFLETLGCQHRFLGNLTNAFEKERKPCFPVAVPPDFIQ